MTMDRRENDVRYIRINLEKDYVKYECALYCNFYEEVIYVNFIIFM